MPHKILALSYQHIPEPELISRAAHFHTAPAVGGPSARDVELTPQSALLVFMLQDLDVAPRGKFKSEHLFLLKLLLLPQTLGSGSV